MDWVEYGRTILKQEGHDDWSFRLDIEALPSLCIHHNKYIWLAKPHQNDIFYIVHEIAHIPFLNLDEGDLGHHRRWAAEFHRLLSEYVVPLPIGGTVKELGEGDRWATQIHMIFSVLTKHCDRDFSADKIEVAMADIKREISEGGCAWAFEEPVKKSPVDWYHDGGCICQSSPPGFVAQDGIHCGMCGGTLRPRESTKAIPKAVIDAFRDDEEALLKEHQEQTRAADDKERDSYNIECPRYHDTRCTGDKCQYWDSEKGCTWKSAAEMAFPIIPVPVSERPSGTIKCCQECLIFHQSAAKRLMSLADPDAPNDGCQCKCHDPSTPEGAALTKHFDSLDPVTECDYCAGTGEAKLDKDGNELYNGFMGKCPYCSPPPKEPWICPHRDGCIYFEQRRCHGQVEGFCLYDEGHPPNEEPAMHGNWPHKNIPPPFAEEPKWKCIACGLEQPATNEVCPDCGQMRELVREPDDMIGRGGTDPNEREK